MQSTQPSKLDCYINALKRLLGRTSLRLNVEQVGDEIQIGSIRFSSNFKQRLYQEDSRPNRGVLASSLSKEEVIYCHEKGISYFTLDGRLHLVTSRYGLTIDSRKVRETPRNRPRQTNMLTRRGPQPTTLISPNSLPILDVLFRLPMPELHAFNSALSFARKYQLNQSKLSVMMRALNVQSLSALRKQIAQLNLDWWSLALAYPATKKGLTPFFLHSTPFQAVEKVSPHESQAQLKDLLDSTVIQDLVPGPVEVAKGIGAITDPDIYLWGTVSALQMLKRKFRLVPGASKDKVTWHLATPQRGMAQEAILSRLPVTRHQQLGIQYFHANYFRAIWDLTFGSERLKEVRIQMLRRFIEDAG